MFFARLEYNTWWLLALGLVGMCVQFVFMELPWAVALFSVCVSLASSLREKV